MRQRTTYYVAGYMASAMGFACFNTILSNSKFALIAMVLTAVGFYISWSTRTRTLTKQKSEAVVLICLLAILGGMFVIGGIRNQVLPDEVTGAPDLFMGVMLSWLMVACSFRLSNDRSIVFICVPSLSLIGLTATFDPNLEVLTFFGIFLALACFILIRQNTFAYQDQTHRPEGTLRLSAGSMRLHIGITASVTLVALVSGIALGTLLYPRLVQKFTREIAPFDTLQLAEQLTSEEYVPVATGPVDLSNQELMTVRCDRYLLWRGRTYNRYTGQGWVNEFLPNQKSLIHPVNAQGNSGDKARNNTFMVPRHPLYETSRVSERVEQTFTVVSGYYLAIFAATQPRIIKFNGQGFNPPFLRYENGIQAVRRYGPKDSYTVVSRVNSASIRQLSSASQNYPEIIERRYLGYPETCWQVQKLAQRVTAGEPNLYRKALAIQIFLESNYKYDTSAPAAPEHEDAVQYFLFKSKRGYCDIFASSMVIMARQIGIPARWVTGFAPGEIQQDGIYHIRAKDRHAWAELYFPGYGWIDFDATPSAADTTWLTRLKDLWALLSADRSTLTVGLVVIFLLGYLIKAEVVDRFWKLRRRPRTREEICAAEVSRNFRRMCDILNRAGYPRHPSMTPWEYAGSLNNLFRPNLEELSSTVDAITTNFVEFRYSPREPSPDALASMSRAVQDMARSLKLAKKQNLLPQNRHS